MNFDRLTAMLTARLSDALSAHRQTSEAPFLFGVSGGQGAGKSTLCAALTENLNRQGHRCLTLALDDFYLPKPMRQNLADTIHPNCLTRGVPGTHDIALLSASLAALAEAKTDDTTPLPVFSKSHDDRLPPTQWQAFNGRPDIILLEGWCVGGRAAFLDNHATTAWEQETDPHQIWLQWTRRQAAPYEAIWDRCDAMMLLRQESFNAVIDSRWLQEQDNAAASGVWQFNSRQEVSAFCAYYESWTQAIWQHLPAIAVYTIIRDPSFNYHLEED